MAQEIQELRIDVGEQLMEFGVLGAQPCEGLVEVLSAVGIGDEALVLGSWEADFADDGFANGEVETWSFDEMSSGFMSE